MTKPEPPRLLSEIRSAETPSSTRLAALRVLKNDITGHDQRKEAWIEWGIVPLLTEVLSSRRTAGNKSVTREQSSGGYPLKRRHSRSEEDEICLQAIIILGSLAQGGPAYLSPIFASNVLPALLQVFSSQACPQSLILQILETLNTIADRLPLDPRQTGQEAKQLCQLLFSREHLPTLCAVIERTSPSSTTQLSIALAANLIAKICMEEVHKASLAEAGILDALALKLATFVVAQGFVPPGAESRAADQGALGSLPPAAPPTARLAPILRAIAVIIENSKCRAEHFLSSPGMVTVFPKYIREILLDAKKQPWGPSPVPGYGTGFQRSSELLDSILPAVPAPQTKQSMNWPALGPEGSYGSYGKQPQFFTPPSSFPEQQQDEEDESPVVSWLLHVSRIESSLARLMAARVITILFRLGLARSERLPMLNFLLVPLLVRMLDKDYEVNPEFDRCEDGLIPTALRIKEEAPAVLATLVMDRSDLQKYAVDGGAIKKLAQMLKESFNPVSDEGKPMWNSDKQAYPPSVECPSEQRLGLSGFSPMVMHKMRHRESILRALAALTLFNDHYRKAVCECGLVSYIIDSMKPCEIPEGYADTKGLSVDGNPTSTLLAACAAARSLTRSVCVLRTSLVDAGIAQPIFTLVKSQNIDVQIAATSVMCNLALDFSPMKESIVSSNMIPVLCEHAHSSNTKLRLESLWALKHIAYDSSNEIKMDIVHHLEPGWLKQVISQDPGELQVRQRTEEEISNGSALGMGTPNSIGERVDLLNPMDDTNRRDSSSGEDQRMTDVATPTKPIVDTFVSDNARRRKLALHGDLDNTKQARRDDIQVQEQALDLIRNLICGTPASAMIDFIFQEMGQADLFNILADKLRPKPLGVSNRKESVLAKSHPVPAEILCAVTYIIAHLATGTTRQRQLIMSHPDLLRLMMTLFKHSDRQIRVNCVWVIINLTCADDRSDQGSCGERAVKLNALGVMDHLKRLETDSDLDVKERTKTALHFMRTLLAPPPPPPQQ